MKRSVVDKNKERTREITQNTIILKRIKPCAQSCTWSPLLVGSTWLVDLHYTDSLRQKETQNRKSANNSHTKLIKAHRKGLLFE
jgi:hypothetical protein